MIFRQYRFDSAIPASEFLERLRALAPHRLVMFPSKRGSLYGKVVERRFELRTPSTSRGNVIWVIGQIDPATTNTAGRLRVIPEPLGSFSLILIAAVAVGIQFLSAASWLRIVLPTFAVAAILFGVLAGRAEWHTIVDCLRNDLGVTIGTV